MKRLFFSIVLLVLAMTAIVSCLEPYNPPVTRENVNYLVVNAFLNANGEVSVKLSRTLPLYSSGTASLESGAEVYLMSESGEASLIPEEFPGTYSGVVTTDISKKYRIRIRTSKGEDIISDYTEVKITPPIDSIYWTPETDGVNIYVDTHDPENKTRFYKWNFEETFEYTSAYASSLLFIDGVVSPRPVDQYIYLCWRTDVPSNILVGSSINRSSDAIRFHPLTFVPVVTRKLGRKYSIQVQQQAITEQAYNYWLQIEQTTESLGGLFDPMPAEVTGNFHNQTNPSEPVIGFFSAGSVEKKRLFIDFGDLPDHLKRLPNRGCILDTIPLADLILYGNSTTLVTPYGSPFTEGYLTSSNICIDCRLQGGTTTRPDFWE